MSQSFLPEIDIRIGSRRPQANSIHSFAHLPKKHKLKNSKYELIKQSIISPIATPLHQLVRISLSNKTVIFKKRLVTQQAYERQNQSPVHYHQTNKVVILKPSPRLKSEPGGSQLKACKSLLNAKVREKRVSMDLHQRLPLNDRNRQDYSVSQHLNQSNRGCSPNRNQPQEFQLCPWKDDQQQFPIKSVQIKKQRFLDQIKRCL